MPASSQAPDKPGAKSGARSDAKSAKPGTIKPGTFTATRERGRSGRGKKNAPVVIPLEHARWRHFGWAAFCMIVGGLLLLKLGSVGQFLGLSLIALAIYRGYRFAKTLLLPAGTIEVTASHVELPLGLCNGKSDRIALDEVGHVFFLRRAVSWTTTGPVLVVEAGDRAYSYPRDWFESEADQRMILQRLLNHSRPEKADSSKGDSSKGDSSKGDSAKEAKVPKATVAKAKPGSVQRPAST